MPPRHREGVHAPEEVSRVRAFVTENTGLYIHIHAQRNNSNPTEVGTGGTPFMKYLKKHRDDLNAYRTSG